MEYNTLTPADLQVHLRPHLVLAAIQAELKLDLWTWRPRSVFSSSTCTVLSLCASWVDRHHTPTWSLVRSQLRVQFRFFLTLSALKEFTEAPTHDQHSAMCCINDFRRKGMTVSWLFNILDCRILPGVIPSFNSLNPVAKSSHPILFQSVLV